MLYQVIYSSRATRPMDSSRLETILDDARVGNEARNVTGALVYVDGVFLQILEGEREVLEALLDSIRDDTRHDSMKVFYTAEIAERAFSDWRMAYLGTNVADMSRWAGLEGASSVDDLLRKVHQDSQKVPRVLVSIVDALASHPKDRRRT